MRPSSARSPLARCVRWPGCLLPVFVLLGTLALPPAAAEEEWERAVVRAQRQQDRLMKSAQTRGTGLVNVVRRYKQQVINKGSALNYYLLGRVLYYDKRADDSVRHLRRALELDPRFHFADLALAIIYLSKERPDDAEFHILELRRKKPDDPQGLKLEASLRMNRQEYPAALALLRRTLDRDRDDLEARRGLALCYLGMKDWPRAKRELGFLIARMPDDMMLRRSLVECLLKQEDWKGATRELKQLVRLVKGDPLLYWQLGLALYKQELRAEAAAALEKLNALTAKPVLYVLDLLQVIYGQLEQPEKRLETLARMLPLLEDPEERQRLEQLIEALRQGAGTGSTAEWKRNPLAELLERCIHADVAIRRKALHEYYELDLPFVDPIIYRRYDPRVEPDAVCRIWVVRILGRYRAGEADPGVVREVSRYVALALEDPESRVRTVAAEELGHIGAKAGLLYLLPHVGAIRLSPLPVDPATRRRLESEFNAARLALSQLTGRRDVPPSEANWVPAERLASVRQGWIEWMDTSEGAQLRLQALAELAEITDIDPRWQLRYVLVDVIRPSPAPVGLASYRLLRDRVASLGDKAAQDPWWKTFPLLPDAELTEAKLPKLRERLKAWWTSLDRKQKKPEQGG